MKNWLHQLTTLQIAVAFSVALHAALLGWRTLDPIGLAPRFRGRAPWCLALLLNRGDCYH